ncbi:MAG: neutral/alkaline non-lysosomal ceramidase N-terminal domain-containing protein [Planctomycetota bacterium]|nr:neutral/alkaline non-lysosomal ceramidase N-terminal domain-containing protein [Planctomycetota bacterium]
MRIVLIALITISSSTHLDGAQNANRAVSSNRFTYLNGHDVCLIGHSLPGHIATRWHGQTSVGNVVLVDLSRIGERIDLVLQTVRDYNLQRDPNVIVRWLPGNTDAAIVDVNGDGALDVITRNATRAETHLWSTRDESWAKVGFPVATGAGGVRWGVVEPGGPVTILVRSIGVTGAWQFVGGQWQAVGQLTSGLELDGRRVLTGSAGQDRGVRLRDLDGDGCCELIAGGIARRGILQWSDRQKRWLAAPFMLPDGLAVIDDRGGDAGIRFVDVDADGDQDIIFSDALRYAVYLFDSMETGWATRLVAVERSGPATEGIPPISVAGRTAPSWYDSTTQTVNTPRGKGTLSLRHVLAEQRLRPIQTAASEGFAAIVSNDGSQDEWYNYEGKVVPNYHLRQTKIDTRLVWETPPVRIGESEHAVHMVFLGAIGYRSQPTTKGYGLEIDGQLKLRFDITEHLTRWQSANGDTGLLFRPTWRSGEDAAGFFYLSLARDLVTPGKSVQVGIRSLGSGSQRWFALHPVKDVVVRQPELQAAAVVSNKQPDESTVYQVGVAAVDVTPDHPIRLRGYSGRVSESEGVVQSLWAKSLVIRSPQRPAALLITLDNCLVPAHLRQELAERLQRRVGLLPDRLSITATHTHNGPILAGMSETLYCHPLPQAHREHIEQYTKALIDKLEQVAMAAFENQQPARLSWARGNVAFARNRRTKGGPVDHDLPILVVKDLAGKLRAVYLSYACHCTTLSHNKLSGDWAGYAQESIQRSFPGVTALVSVGCGADANPARGGGSPDEVAALHGREIGAEVARLLQQKLRPLSGAFNVMFSTVDLHLAALPGRAEWERRAQRDADRGGTIGFHARVHLERLDRGEVIKTKVPLPVQTWTFGNSLAIVFLGGEVVVDYALRLKQELDPQRLWINSYANDVPCYIPSERVLREGGYEGGGAMTFHDWAAPFRPGLEQKIVDEVHYQLTDRYRRYPYLRSHQ